MSKQFVVKIGYQNYVVAQEDAVQLLAIASRMKQVARVGYSGAYYIKADQDDPWLDTIAMAEVLPHEPTPAPPTPIEAAPVPAPPEDNIPF